MECQAKMMVFLGLDKGNNAYITDDNGNMELALKDDGGRNLKVTQ